MEPKTIGIVAVTAEGGALCYRTIVSESAALLPAQVHPPIVLHNPPLSLTNRYLQARDWPGLAALLNESIGKLVSIGAQLIVLPANAPHYALDYILPACPVPFVSIVETTVAACARHCVHHTNTSRTGHCEPRDLRGDHPCACHRNWRPAHR